MKFFGLDIRREQKDLNIQDFISRLLSVQGGGLAPVTPDNCMASPTVHAIVTAISRRLSVTPVHVYRSTTKDGRAYKEKLPSHPVARLLAYPNKWQTRAAFWADAASAYVRYGRFYAYKVQGSTGPIRELLPLVPSRVRLEQDQQNWAVIAKITHDSGAIEEKPLSKLLHARGAARNFLEGDSPVEDVAQAIALEILAEKFGNSFFNNGAIPLMIFKFIEGSKGFKTAEQEKQFISDFQNALGGNNRHKAMLLPAGMATGDPVKIENDKAQFLETRKYQRTVIAGAFGVPPHLVGDLERATFNNVEQQDQDFTLNVVMPVAQAFEAAMERDLLTDEDWNRGVVIRFNLDSILRADFKSRQEGLQMQRINGVLSGDEWREIEGKNPLDDDNGGDEYWRPANMAVAGEPVIAPVIAPPKPATDPTTLPNEPNGAADDNAQ
jgi:HK97 family phage portal protein